MISSPGGFRPLSGLMILNVLPSNEFMTWRIGEFPSPVGANDSKPLASFWCWFLNLLYCFHPLSGLMILNLSNDKKLYDMMHGKFPSPVGANDFKLCSG